MRCFIYFTFAVFDFLRFSKVVAVAADVDNDVSVIASPKKFYFLCRLFTFKFCARSVATLCCTEQQQQQQKSVARLLN